MFFRVHIYISVDECCGVCAFLQPLSRGSVLSYILSTSNALGHLKVLRLWHDDSAEGEHASWYLSRVVLEDLQTGEM